MPAIPLTAPVLDQIAERFRALGEPNRLMILSVLRDGERNGAELMHETGLAQANLSKHLRMLHAAGFVARRKEGLHVYYRLRDEDVFRICDLVCNRLESELRGLLEPAKAQRKAGRGRKRG